jgi:phage major head subunit gpT-like protein
MEVTQSNLDIIFRQASIAYQSLYDATAIWSPQLSDTMPSASRQVTYGWMDRLPIMRKWIGNRAIANAITHQRTVTNDIFELTCQLLKQDVQDDQLGIFNYAVRSLAEQAKKWPDQRIADFIVNSAATVAGFDGVPQFSTAHPINGGDVAGGLSGTQANLFTSTALTYDNYVAVREAMMSWIGADGQPLGVMPNLLVVPPQLESEAKQILQSDFLPAFASTATSNASQTNVYKNTAEILVIRELANKPTNWWMFDTTKVVKPYLWQLRQSPTFAQLTAPTDIPVFMANQFIYGVDARGAAAETIWFLSAAGCSGSSY